MIEQDTLPVGASVRTSTYYACLPACRCLHVLAQARPTMTCIALVICRIFYLLVYLLLGERERAHLVLRLGRAVCIYIYIYIYTVYTTDRIPKCFYALLFHRRLSTFHGTQYGTRETGLLQRREGASRH